MREALPESVGVKASGGIETLADASVVHQRRRRSRREPAPRPSIMREVTALGGRR